MSYLFFSPNPCPPVEMTSGSQVIAASAASAAPAAVKYVRNSGVTRLHLSHTSTNVHPREIVTPMRRAGPTSKPASSSSPSSHSSPSRYPPPAPHHLVKFPHPQYAVSKVCCPAHPCLPPRTPDTSVTNVSMSLAAASALFDSDSASDRIVHYHPIHTPLEVLLVDLKLCEVESCGAQ